MRKEVSMVKIVVLVDYFDLTLNRYLRKGEAHEMTYDRVQEILKVKTISGGSLIKVVTVIHEQPTQKRKKK